MKLKENLLGLVDEVEKLYVRVSNDNAISDIDLPRIHGILSKNYSFSEPKSVSEITEDVNMMLAKWTLQTNHPRHFGLYQPSVRSTGVIADALAAIYNPQLGAWWFSPAANEIEKHCLNYISKKFRFDPNKTFSCFTSGGSESTSSAVLSALTRQFPNYGNEGLIGFTNHPKIYASSDAHDSIVKIAHQAGLGRNAVTRIQTDSSQRLDINKISLQIKKDRKNNNVPFFLVATVGTTALGTIDPIPELVEFCSSENIWLHIDGAWGGGFVLSNKTDKYLKGIEGVDSITWDPHKSLPIPTGAGFFLCKHKEVVKNTFNVSASYVPDEIEGQVDLYKVGLLWSRRFIGLKIFMLFAELGEKGIASMIEHQFEMGRYLLKRLKETGWTIENNSPLPVVCFSHPNSRHTTEEILMRVLERKKCWISQIKLKDERSALRACITSYKTKKKDIEILIEELNRSRI